MERALYDPKEGFYTSRVPKEDFYTAPELHPLFGELLAAELRARLEAVARARPHAPLAIVELGSGDGTLARQVLRAFAERHREWLPRIRYILVERVERFLLESIYALRDTGARLLGYTRLEDLHPFSGVVFSNELMDALPVHLLEKREGKVREVYVEGERLELGEPSGSALAEEARAVAELLPEGGRHAVSLEAERVLGVLAEKLQAGAVVTIDYGARFPAGAPNPPRAFYRHTVGSELAARAGEQDLTASVDFERLIASGERLGLRAVSFLTLASFLLERGILERLPAGDGPRAFAERARVKTLFHPDGMGDRFKVLIQEKGITAKNPVLPA